MKPVVYFQELKIEEEPVFQEPTKSKPFKSKERPPLKSSASLPETTFKNNDTHSTSKPEPAPRKAIDNEKKKSPTKDYASESGNKAQSMPPEKKTEVAGTSRPRSRSIFDLIKPQSNDTLKKDLKVII